MSFVFSYNPSDPDLPSTSSYASTSHLHNHLTAVVPPAPPLYHAGLGARSRFDGEDDHVPSYGPTTSRRGRMRFVPASDGGLGVLPATGGTGKTEDGREKGKGRAVEAEEGEGAKQDDKTEEEKEELPPPLPSKKLPGSSVRGLYESIVGVKLQQSAPASLRASPAPPPAAAKALFRPAFSEPPDRAGSVDVKQEEEEDNVLVLSSDEEEEAPVPKETKQRRVAKPPPPPQDAEEDDDDLIVLDPSTGLPLPALSSSSTSTTSPSPTPPPPPRSFSYNPPPSSSRVRPLLIHQLLPSPSSAAVQLPTHYALKPDNPGWRMLQKQGWKEGAPLGPDGAVPPPTPPVSHPAAAPLAAAYRPLPPPAPPRGLLVPLRPAPKNDRLGLGSVGTTKDALRRLTPAERERERLKREMEEKKEREKRGRGTRGMERVRKGEERERKAWIAYMNR